MIATHLCPYSGHLIVEHRIRWWSREYWRVPMRHGDVRTIASTQPVRTQARACRMDRRRWKRRRFIHSLRSAA